MAYRDDKIEHRRRLALLDEVRACRPCPAPWDEMVGDGRKRRCGVCDRNVYNISDLASDEAAGLVSEGEGRRSHQLFRRHDGTVLTADCPWGVRRSRVRRAVALFAASALTTAFVTALDPLPADPRPRHAHETVEPVHDPGEM